ADLRRGRLRLRLRLRGLSEPPPAPSAAAADAAPEPDRTQRLPDHRPAGRARLHRPADRTKRLPDHLASPPPPPPPPSPPRPPPLPAPTATPLATGRASQAHLFPVSGPMASSGNASISASLSSIPSGHGKFAVTMPDGEVCEGTYKTASDPNWEVGKGRPIV